MVVVCKQSHYFDFYMEFQCFAGFSYLQNYLLFTRQNDFRKHVKIALIYTNVVVNAKCVQKGIRGRVEIGRKRKRTYRSIQAVALRERVALNVTWRGIARVFSHLRVLFSDSFAIFIYIYICKVLT